MRLKKPRLLNLAVGVSLLLAIAIVALWVRSHGRDESIVRKWQTSTERCDWIAQSCYSSIWIMIACDSRLGAPTAPSYLYWDQSRHNPADAPLLHWFVFPPVQLRHLSPPSYPYDLRFLTIAYWLLLLPTLPLPLIALARHRRRRQRETNNLCPTCGYDLRATPDRCPECGVVPASSVVRGQ